VRVYISGPMRGHPDCNYPTFNAVEDELKRNGGGFPNCVEVINPAKNFDGNPDLDYETYMQVDLMQVLEADVIVLLPGWTESEGAKLEVAVAQAIGLSFYLAYLTSDKGWQFIPRTPSRQTAPVMPLTGPDSPVEAETSTARGSVLEEAKQLINGDRNNQYGPPTQDFKRTADMATGFGFTVNGLPLQAHHVAVFMMLLKTSRLAWTPGKRDSWVDAAGYAGCGYECAVEDGEEAA
jgi:hypothetical protein